MIKPFDPDEFLIAIQARSQRAADMREAVLSEPDAKNAVHPLEISRDRVFISYSRSDWESRVKPLIEHLNTQGISSWVDQHILRGGDDWLDSINDALEECVCMILCVSPEALNSRYVKMEYRYFIDEDKPLIPVICRETKLPVELRGIQHLAYGDMDSIVKRLREYDAD